MFFLYVCNLSVSYIFILLTVEKTILSLFVLLEPWWISFGHVSMSFLGGYLFWSLGLCICFYVNSIQFWFLWLCNVFWSQEVRSLHLCSLFSWFFCLFGVLSGSICILGSFFFFSYFFENDIGILIGITMNLYLALGSVEMSTIISLQSMNMICHFNYLFLV